MFNLASPSRWCLSWGSFCSTFFPHFHATPGNHLVLVMWFLWCLALDILGLSPHHQRRSSRTSTPLCKICPKTRQAHGPRMYRSWYYWMILDAEKWAASFNINSTDVEKINPILIEDGVSQVGMCVAVWFAWNCQTTSKGSSIPSIAIFKTCGRQLSVQNAK